jgi:hypothetical protein
MLRPYIGKLLPKAQFGEWDWAQFEVWGQVQAPGQDWESFLEQDLGLVLERVEGKDQEPDWECGEPELLGYKPWLQGT